jgi:peroxiredoxin
MPLSVGARAPSYRLRGLDNAYWILGEPDERRSVLLTFFGRDASASRILLPFVERIYRCAHERATEVIGISIDSHRDTLEFATDYTFTFPILIDAPDLEAVRGWGIERHPALYLLDRNLTAIDCLEGWEREGFERVARRHLEEAGAFRKSVWEDHDNPPDSVPSEPIRTLRPVRGLP